MASAHLSPRPLLVLGSLLVLAAAGGHAQVDVTLRMDSALAGTDGNGNVLLHAPDPVQGGSSVSHYSELAFPSLLMEPNLIPSNTPLAPDLTVAHLRDLGWRGGTSNIRFNFLDDPGEGVNDASLGPLRMEALEATAAVWEQVLRSPVNINIDIDFDSLPCMDGGGVLAATSPQFIFVNYPGAPFRNTWYTGPLAEALSGQNLSTVEDGFPPNEGDFSIIVNSDIDTGCLAPGTRFHYDTTPAPNNTVSFVRVALHEIAHGLGFLDLTNRNTGEFCCLGFNDPSLVNPDIYNRFTFDNIQGRHWHQMNAQARQDSIVNMGHLAWDGARVRQEAGNFLDPFPTPLVTVHSPSDLARNFLVGDANFGPALTANGLRGALATARPLRACGPLNNPGEIQGRIAVVDRGVCTFVDKVRNAQDAGAIGVVVVNNQGGLPPRMDGDDNGITIPAVSVSQTLGERLKEEIQKGPAPPPPPDDPPMEEPSDCVPDGVTLCLNGGRFKVSAEWTSQDDSGQGQVISLTDDTGYLWFFNPENVEVVVKVLNACGFADRFWVFAGGLTNVEVDLRVVDTQTGTVKRYDNPQGVAFQPVQDTGAFDTCP